MSKHHIQLLLEQYEKHTCLWDPKNVNYNNENARQAAIDAMIKKLGIKMTPLELRMKIKNVRTIYCKLLNRIENSKKCRTGKVFTPRLTWFPYADKFLRRIVVEKKMKSLVNSIAQEDKICRPCCQHAGQFQGEARLEQEAAELVNGPPIDEAFEEFPSKSVPDQMKKSQIDALDGVSDETVRGFIQDSDRQQLESMQDNPSFLTKKEDTSDDSTVILYTIDPFNEKGEYAPELLSENELSAPEAMAETASKPTEDDEFDIFCKHVACQLRSLPLPNAIMCQSFISSHLFKERLKVVYGEVSQSATTTVPNEDIKDEISTEQ